jgi:hypothetical protein
MKTRDDLLSVLNLGWESARQVWRLFAPEQVPHFLVEAIGTSGQDFDQLAYDLRRLGYGKPARIAFSLAFILNGLTAQSILMDADLAEKTLQIVAVLGEMLLELESTSQVQVEEPTEIFEHIKTRWGLHIHADEQVETTLPRPHFRSRGDDRSRSAIPVAMPVDDDIDSLVRISSQLAQSSQSLLKRVAADETFPYTATLSHIHHLSVSLNAGLTRKLPANRPPMPAIINEPVEPVANASEPIDLERAVLSSEIPAPVDSESIVVSPEPTVPRATQSEAVATQVLIIDESPFFRMLLTSAMQSRGIDSIAAMSLLEAQSIVGDRRWQVAVCSADEMQSAEASLRDWLNESAIELNAAIIAMTNTLPESTTPTTGHHLLRRSDISGLMSLIQLKLSGSQSTRMIA